MIKNIKNLSDVALARKLKKINDIAIQNRTAEQNEIKTIISCELLTRLSAHMDDETIEIYRNIAEMNLNSFQKKMAH